MFPRTCGTSEARVPSGHCLAVPVESFSVIWRDRYLLPVVARGSGPTARGSGVTADGLICAREPMTACGGGPIGADLPGMTTPQA
jgi:hypothetical protein